MLLGILLVVVLVGGIAVGSEAFLRTQTRASGSIQPVGVTISNISDTTFTVSWTTATPATGAISVASGVISNQVIFDDQDTKEQGKYMSHIATFRGARADTSYTVTILSNGKKVSMATNRMPPKLRPSSRPQAEIWNLPMAQY